MFRKTIKLIVFILLFIANYANADGVIFEKKQLQIVNSSGAKYNFTVEIADTVEKQQQGLMFRKKIADNSGMLFLFDKERMVSMWMKDTYIPLDVVFVKTDGTISNIAERTIALSEKSISSAGKVSSVLELKAGTCAKLNIKKNDRISLRD